MFSINVTVITLACLYSAGQKIQIIYNRHHFRGKILRKLKGDVLFVTLYIAVWQSNFFFMHPAFVKTALTVNLPGITASAEEIGSHDCCCIQITIIQPIKVTISGPGTGIAMLCDRFLCWHRKILMGLNMERFVQSEEVLGRPGKSQGLLVWADLLPAGDASAWPRW